VFLTPNPSYVTVSQFKAMPLDYDLSSYTDSQLQDVLNRASGKADSILRRSLLAQEKTVRYTGDGSNKLELRENPVLYIKRLQLVVPGTFGTLIPANQLLIDYQSGSVINYTPVYLMQGLGYYSLFPAGCPIDVTLGYGYGYNATTAPTWTAADNGTGSLAAGTYNVAITTKTMYGETTATVKQCTTATGAFLVTPGNVLGGYVYRAYISSAANNTTLNGAIPAGATSATVHAAGTIAAGDVLLLGSGSTAEYVTVSAVSGSVLTISATVNAHSDGEAVIEQPKLAMESPFTSYGPTGLQFTMSSLTPQNGIWADALPLTDTSAPVLPGAITEAVRLLALSSLYEQNNLANRGVYMEDSGKKRIGWKSTEGTSGRGVPLLEQQAFQLLKPYSLQSIF
jgi:hypothetical protein